MDQTDPNEYKKFFTTPPKAPPPSFSQPTTTTGIPVSSASPSYSESPPSVRPTKLQDDKFPWSSGLCDCGSDVRNCCITCWCPCVTFGQISEIVDKGSSSCGANGTLYTLMICVIGCPCFYSCFYRSRMRQQYSLKESPCCDCLLHCCCESCALCQEYRELKSRGFDMSIGWQGNVENQNRGIAMAPIVEEGMSR